MFFNPLKSFNPFSVPAAIIDGVGRERGYPLIVDGDSMTAGDARAILAESGIDSWALLDRGGEWSCYVPAAAAVRAETLLRRHGAVILGRQLVADGHESAYSDAGEVQPW